MAERPSNRQALSGPVPVRRSENQRGDPFDNGEHGEREGHADKPRPRSAEGDPQLGRPDGGHDESLAEVAVRAERAVLAVRHVNIACHVRTIPQRMASAFENPGTQVNEEQAIDRERQEEGRPFREHG